MNAAALELPLALRNLVDSRLDAIERALMQGNTPRTERCSILEDIETQIIEMLSAEAPDHEPTRTDLLRVFAKLDPPEAFLGEQIESARPTRSAAPDSRVLPVAKSGYSTMGILACVGGLATLAFGLPVCVFTMLFAESEILTFVVVGFLAVAGIPSLVLGILYAIAIHQSAGRLRGLTCAAIGISALPISVVGLLGGFLMLEMDSEFLIFGGLGTVCLLAVVGAIHLTYRGLELLIGDRRRVG